MEEEPPCLQDEAGAPVFSNPLYACLNQTQTVDAATMSGSTENITETASGNTAHGAHGKLEDIDDRQHHEHILSTDQFDIKHDKSSDQINRHTVTRKLTRGDLLDTPCVIHAGETLKFYCINHGALVCGICVPLFHRACDHVEHIPDVAATGCDPAEQGFIHAKLEDLTHKLNTCKESLSSRKKIRIETFETSLAELKQFRDEINTTLDRLENEMIAKIKEQNEEDLKFTESSIERCDELVHEIKAILSEIDERNRMRRYNNLYVALKEARKKISEYEHDVDNVTNCKIGVIYFQRCKTLNDEIKSLTDIGTFSVAPSPTDIKANFLFGIDAKIEKDTANPLIYGMTILPGGEHIVALDLKNKSVKMINLKTRKVESNILLQDRPLDITVVRQDRLAVTLVCRKKILFLKNSRSLSKAHSVDVPAFYHGIHYAADKFVLACVNPESGIHLVSLSGKLIRKINADTLGRALFAHPCGITVSSDNSRINISDDNQHSITCLSMEGDLQYVYKDIKMQFPQGLTTDMDGNVYVCSKSNRKVIQINSKGRFSQVLLDANPSIGHPLGMALDTTNGLMYITNCNTARRRFISVMKLKK